MQNLWDRFRMTDLSNISHYFRIKVDVDLNKKTISFWLSTYLKKILGRYDMSNYKPARILISLGVANFLTLYKDQMKKSIVAWYQSAIRASIWPAMHIYPDPAYSVGILSRFYNNFGSMNIELVKYILQYVFETLDLSLTEKQTHPMMWLSI